MQQLENIIDYHSQLYPVMEYFYTLQGEGAFAGQAAYFIRLGGCDVGCVWCDVKESWEANKHPQVSVGSLLRDAMQYAGRMLVITGGEPSLYDLSALTAVFQQAGFSIHIETSGTNELKGYFDWVTLSPKKFKLPLPEVLAMTSELKVVVYHPSDFEWMQQFVSLLPATCKKYLQAEWSKKEVFNSQITAYVMAHPDWQLSMQTHKYLNIP